MPPEFYHVDPFHLPLINTLVLLLSGCAVTWAHHALVHGGDRKDVEWGLLIAVLLGLAFTFLQAYEYRYLLVVQDWIFGQDKFFSNFFMATGFHGFHVIIGTIFLFVCYLRVRAGHFTAEQHVGLRGGRLVLALRRRGVAVPVLRGLHLGRRLIPQATPTAPRGAGQPAPLRMRHP